MRLESLALCLVSILAGVHAASQAGTVTVYSDDACKDQVEVVQFGGEDVYQCKEFQHQDAKSVIFSTQGFDNLGFNVWDSDYCAGDRAGGLPQYLGHCLSVETYGVQSWKSAHVSPRNGN